MSNEVYAWVDYDYFELFKAGKIHSIAVRSHQENCDYIPVNITASRIERVDLDAHREPEKRVAELERAINALVKNHAEEYCALRDRVKALEIHQDTIFEDIKELIKRVRRI